MKILVTGSSGFIGTHLSNKLRSKNIEVVPYDLLNGQDILNKEQLQKAIQGCDAVYHFAAMVSVPECEKNPTDSFKTNLLGTFEVLNAAAIEQKRSGKKVKFLFAGSSVVYGDSGKENVAIREDIALPRPLSNYGNQKKLSEDMIWGFADSHNLDCVIFRFFNVYGPGQDPKSPYSGVVSILKGCSESKKPFAINGDGKQTRDFIHVEDLVTACVNALDTKFADTGKLPINIGTGETITINQLVQLFQDLSDGFLSSHGEARTGDVRHSKADTSRARNLLNLKPTVDLSTGIKALLTAPN